MKKILIIGPAWVGDMVMSQSLYITLKQLHPESQIDVIAPGWCKPILERMPEIHQAIEMPIGHGEFNLLGRREIGKSLREKQYDHAYILPKSAKSALIPWFANIPLRTGWKGEMRYGL
ncbi:lipopolysaccharide heptosyltransferase II, partial [Vibrio parahaemolyticus]